MSRESVAVIGAGVMGLAAADELSRRGQAVTLYERDRVGHRGGGSWGTARIFRLAYDNPRYVAACVEARGLWRRLEDEVGEPLIVPTGGLDFGDAATVAAVGAALDAAGAPHESLTPEQASARWPGLRLEGEILFQGDAGVIRAQEVIAALHARLLDREVDVREGTEVREVMPGADGVRVVAAEGAEDHDAAVVAAGSWSEHLLGPLFGLPPLIVREEFPLEFDLPGADRLPVGTHYTESAVPADAIYWLAAGPDVMKVGAHCSGRVLADADDRTAECPPEIAAALTEYAAQTFPDLLGEPSDLATGCLYDMTADENFILERRGRVVALAGFSGHGFKFAPLIGAIAADLVEGDDRRRDLLPSSAHLPPAT